MIAERQPLGTLDPNVTRVQPTRAAKTGHKWLSHRKIKSVDENNINPLAFCQSFQCSYLQQKVLLQRAQRANSANAEAESQENPTEKDILCKDRLAFVPCDNHKQSVCRKADPPLRMPLKTIELNTLDNESTHGFAANKNNKPSFFPPLYPSDENSLSSSSTGSDVSFRSASEDEPLDCFLSRSRSSRKSRPYTDPDTYLDNVKERHPDLEVLNEYLSEVLSYMKATELKYKPKENYLKKQTEITASMRVKLVDWLVEVQDEYKLHDETLYLAVAYVDRFLSEMSVTRAKLQLLGTTSMFLAAKFEEIYPPDADEFAYVTADTYTRSEVLLMERMVLKVFNCTLAIPTAFQYLTLFHEKSNLDEDTRYLSFYLSELSLLDDKYLAYTPSVKAAASVSLALCTVRHAHYCDVANGNLSVENNSGNMSLEIGDNGNTILNFPRVVVSSLIKNAMSQDIEMIFQCVLQLAKSHVQENNSSHFIREKYTSSSRRHVAKITPALADASFQQIQPLSRNNVTSLWLT